MAYFTRATRAASTNREVSHIFIPHRNRLARPNNAIDGVRLEQSLLEAGLTLVFQDRVCNPIPKGTRQKLEDLLVAVLDYNYAGEYRSELARKILKAQIASNPDSFRAIETVIAELKQCERALVIELKSAESRSDISADPSEEIEAALAFAERLSELASDGENFALAREAFAVADAKLFVRFKPVCKKKRTANQISGSVVTLGAAAPPIDIYDGPTNRNKVKETSPQAATAAQGPCERRSPTGSDVQDFDREEMSLGNVNRGDRTPVELFINGVLLVAGSSGA